MPNARKRLGLARQALVNRRIALAVLARDLQRNVLTRYAVGRRVEVRDPAGADMAPDHVAMFDEGPGLECRAFHVRP